MANFTDKDYYILEANIPDSILNDLDAYITRYEKEILIDLFGYALWKLINAYDSNNPGNSPQRIRDIVEGKEYTVDGDLIKWNGLINDDKISLLSYYVYYWWVRNNGTTLHMTGVALLKSENSEPESASQKISAAWGRLRELYGYPSQDFYQPSAYNFMIEFESDYSEWVFERIGHVNSFDL